MCLLLLFSTYIFIIFYINIFSYYCIWDFLLSGYIFFYSSIFIHKMYLYVFPCIVVHCIYHNYTKNFVFFECLSFLTSLPSINSTFWMLLTTALLTINLIHSALLLFLYTPDQFIHYQSFNSFILWHIIFIFGIPK